MDFVIADKAQTGAIYFMASEEDLRIGLSRPWTSIGLDAGECLSTGRYMSRTPIRAPWVLCRASSAATSVASISCHSECAIRKITSLPAQREHLENRGLLKSGYFADITIFDPATIIDHADFTKPDQLSEGIDFTIVNGQVECDHGKLTARPLAVCCAATAGSRQRTKI